MKLFSNKPAFTPIDPVKIAYNVGALFDLPLGEYVKGKHNESILNGGLGIITGFAGRGNSFKSTIMHDLILTAASRVCASGMDTYINTFDTEINMSVNRLYQFTQKHEIFKNRNIIEEGLWSITDKTKHSGNEWFELLKKFLKEEKIKRKKELTFDTPMLDSKGNPIQTLFPTFGEIDSMSEFDVDTVQDIQDKSELGESTGNMIHMRLGLVKTRLMMELPALLNSSAHYLGLTAHMGDDNAAVQGPYNQPVKKLSTMKQGEKIKGISDKFLFLSNLFVQTTNVSVLNNQTTKGPEYPKKRDQPDEGSTDLNIVTIKYLRSKQGMSGCILNLVVSQTEGLLPSLTEFHYIKENNRYGLEGNNVNYNLALYPSVKIMRTTVRELIDNDYKLRRAIKISADLLQIEKFNKLGDVKVPTPKELYEKLKNKYDWNVLLETRDWWTFNNDSVDKPFLSTMDLINMYYDKYEPYWLK
jgi:hypothetical protein